MGEHRVEDDFHRESGEGRTRGRRRAVRPPRRRRLALGAALGLVTIGAGGLAAASLNEPTMIHACVSRGLLGVTKGSVRIVDDPSQCSSIENRVSWERGARASRRWYADRDADSFGDWYDRLDSAVKPVGYVDNNRDCNDDRADVHPATGRNDGVGWDFDCDGVANEAAIAWYPDKDGDGLGWLPGKTIGSTTGGPPTPGMVRLSGDCDDTTAAITTQCRDFDYWFRWSEEQHGYIRNMADEDQDGHRRAELFEGEPMGDDCDDNERRVYPGNTEHRYDGLDNDCDPATLDVEPYVSDVGRHDPQAWGIRSP